MSCNVGNRHGGPAPNAMHSWETLRQSGIRKKRKAEHYWVRILLCCFLPQVDITLSFPIYKIG